MELCLLIKQNKQEKSEKQAEMYRNTPIFRLHTPGCCRPRHPDVHGSDTRMFGKITYQSVVIKILAKKKKTVCFTKHG